jgi:thiamine biosynthesis lipoprotein
MIRYSLNGETMGTRYSAVFHAAPGLDRQQVGAALFAAVDQVDRQMSTWKPDSDLCRLNAAPEGQWLAMPRELVQVLATALDVSARSDGAFDIGVGALVDAWGFGPAARQPAPAQLGALRERAWRPAAQALDIDVFQGRVRKRAALQLDLSGIAKGYGVDQLAHCLDRRGIRSYLVGIDGEMRARGLKPGGQRWAVAVEKPVAGRREAMGVMALADQAIATSGDYRQSVTLAGQRYSHTMNPTLREPVRNRIAAVTVLASSCMLADAWATALLVSGETAGPALARKLGLHALFMLRDGTGPDALSIIDTSC